MKIIHLPDRKAHHVVASLLMLVSDVHLQEPFDRVRDRRRRGLRGLRQGRVMSGEGHVHHLRNALQDKTI